jgi:eukaryotic-like serine/threonine-protein kinase
MVHDPHAETFGADSPTAAGVTQGVGPTLPGLEGNGAQAAPGTIGRYRILRLLGEGGMGAVYEAEQENPQRTVALKVIRAGYADAEVLRRFENETRALGRLQHAGIAQIYDAGTAETPLGRQPYFAMELVRGQALLRYCDEHKLDVRERLELAAKVCDAVQHAHQRGLIHRDLKPANILVDESGQPKILDFGIARLTDSDAQATRQTSVGQIIGTLAYMSPEQVSGDPDEVDTRSDVYALGVVLYELLAGKAPYATGRQVHEAVRAIREEEPTRLSSLKRTLRGDVETIVAKALEKDKARRYASAAELAADIRRHLHDEPIVARPASTAYQIQKFARRNKVLVGGIAAVFVVLVLGIVASTREAVLARRAQKKAQQESAIAQAVNDFLQTDLLGQASAYNQAKPDPNITVRTVLDRAAHNIQGKFRAQPDVEAAIRQTIGDTYGDLGLYSEEQKQLRQAEQMSERALGAENPKTLNIRADLMEAMNDSGHSVEAEPMARALVATERRVLGDHSRETLHGMSVLAHSLHFQSKFQEAEALYKEILDVERRIYGGRDAQAAITLNNLESVYLDADEWANATTTGAEALELSREVFGADHPYTVSALENLASADVENGNYDEAERLYQQVLDADRRIFGPDHPKTLLTMDNLGGALTMHGKYEPAEALLVETVAAYRRVLGPQHPLTLSAMFDLGDAYDAGGQFGQAHTVFAELLSTSRAASNPDPGIVSGAMTNVAWTDYQLGHYGEAEALEKELLANAHSNPNEDIAEILDTQGNLASAYLAEGRTGEADALYRRTLASMEHALKPGSRYILEILGHLAEACRREGLYAQEADDALAAWNGRVHLAGATSPDSLAAEADLALADLSEGKAAEAEQHARAVVDGEKKGSTDGWQRYWGESLLGESLVQQKRGDGAALLNEGLAGMRARRSEIDAPDQYHVTLAEEWASRARTGHGAAR